MVARCPSGAASMAKDVRLLKIGRQATRLLFREALVALLLSNSTNTTGSSINSAENPG